MTLANFLDVLTGKVSISIINNATDKEILCIKSDEGVSANLADAVSGATIRRITLEGASSIKLVVELAS